MDVHGLQFKKNLIDYLDRNGSHGFEGDVLAFQ